MAPSPPFRFRQVPRAHSHRSRQPPTHTRRPLAPRGPLAGCTALAVDDSHEISSLVADALALAGARSVTVHNGTDALALLEERGFDLVVLDMRMPPPDGPHICRHLRHRRDILDRTIVLTARRYDAGVNQTIREYGVAYVFKPFQIEELIATAVERVCRGAAAPSAESA